MVYEGALLPKVFQNQMIHTDPGRNIVRAYPVSNDAAGYKATTVDILAGTRNQWFRPCDVCAAPDGSLFVADWYDPGVGGHAQGDTNRGRIFRIAPKGSKYTVPKFNFNAIDGCIEALKNPCLAVRYLAWTKLHAFGARAEPALAKLLESENPRYRALRCGCSASSTARRKNISRRRWPIPMPTCESPPCAARQTSLDIIPLVTKLVHDTSPQVRRECAFALRHNKSPEAAALWTELALQHDGADRWYVEALGIGADKQWDTFFAAWLKKVGSQWNGAAGRDIVWRSRSAEALPLLAKLILDPAVKEPERLRYFRAFDFHAEPAKQEVLVGLLGGSHPQQAAINALALHQLHGVRPNSPEFKAALGRALDGCRGTDQFLDLVINYDIADRDNDLLVMALADPTGTTGVRAAKRLLQTGKGQLFQKPLAADDATAEKAITVLGLTQEKGCVELLLPLVLNPKRTQSLRSGGVTALGKSKLGEEALLDLAAHGKITVELQFAAARSLEASHDAKIRTAAAKYLKLPEPAGGKPLPKLSELLKRRGSIEHGKLIFNTTGTCAKCHTVNGVGKEVGPNLSEIAGKFPRDALYESILFPSAAIAHNYETHRLELENGNVVQGIIVSETADSISIRTAEAIVQTYKKKEVAENSEVKISLMPADLQKLLTTEDLVDVVEYLSTLKKAK